MVTRADWQAYIDLAKSEDILRIAQDLGCRLKKVATAEFAGPCLINGGTNRFSLNTRKQVFNCRGVEDGGDIIKMVCHLLGCSVAEACERITGRPRPNSSRDETMEERAARMRENASRMEAARIRQEKEREVERIKAQRDESQISEIIDRAVPIEGTHAEAYLRHGRGLTPNKRLLVEPAVCRRARLLGGAGQRFGRGPASGDRPGADRRHPQLRWRHHRHRADLSRPEGAAEVASERQRAQLAEEDQGTEAGRHDPSRPGDRNAGDWRGLGNPLAWHQLGGGLHIDNLSLAAAVNRGNLSGQSLGKTSHPKAVEPEGGRVRMPSGLPDLDAPGVIVPDGVKTIIIIANANSDAYATAAYYVTAGNRFQHHGLKVGIAWPPPGYNWNDVLVKEQAREEVEGARMKKQPSLKNKRRCEPQRQDQGGAQGRQDPPAVEGCTQRKNGRTTEYKRLE